MAIRTSKQVSQATTEELQKMWATMGDYFRDEQGIPYAETLSQLRHNCLRDHIRSEIRDREHQQNTWLIDEDDNAIDPQEAFKSMMGGVSRQG
jgi:hypothetical protein